MLPMPDYVDENQPLRNKEYKECHSGVTLALHSPISKKPRSPTSSTTTTTTTTSTTATMPGTRAAKRTHKCTVCNRVFTRKDNLSAHQRVHTDERPFKCGVCPRAFRWLSALRHHELMHRRRELKRRLIALMAIEDAEAKASAKGKGKGVGKGKKEVMEIKVEEPVVVIEVEREKGEEKEEEEEEKVEVEVVEIKIEKECKVVQDGNIAVGDANELFDRMPGMSFSEFAHLPADFFDMGVRKSEGLEGVFTEVPTSPTSPTSPAPMGGMELPLSMAVVCSSNGGALYSKDEVERF